MSKNPQAKGGAAAHGAEYLPDDDDVPSQSLPSESGESATLLPSAASSVAGDYAIQLPKQSKLSALRARLRLVEASLCMVAVATIWVGASVLVQKLFDDVHAQLPFFLTYVCVSEFVVLLPMRYIMETWLREGLSFGRVGSLTLGIGATKATDWRAAARAALFVCPLWFLAQSTYNASLGGASVSSSTVLSTTSCVWTFALSVLVLKERFDWRRLGGVLVTLAGAAVVSYGDSRSGGSGRGYSSTWWGDALALGSALCYGLYTTAIRRLVPDDGTISLSVFFGFLGLFNSVLMLPVVIGLVTSGIEQVWRATPRFIGWVLLKGLFDNVLSDIIWGHAIVISSPTLATVGLALTIPLAMLAELLVSGTAPSLSLAAGSALVVTGFVAITLLGVEGGEKAAAPAAAASTSASGDPER